MAGTGGVLVITLNPILTTLFASLIFGNKLLKKDWIGLVLGLLGGAVIIRSWEIDLESLLQSGNLYFASSGGYGQSAIDSTAYMAAENKAFGLRTSTFITTMADDSTKNIVTNGSGLIIISSYTYGRVAIYKHDYIGGPTLITGDTLYYTTSNTDGKYSLESGSNSFTATLRNRFGGNADFKVMFIGTYQ